MTGKHPPATLALRGRVPARFLVSLALLLLALPVLAASSLSERLNESYLGALRDSVRVLRERARPSDRSGEYQDVRCVFHAHSRLSHDSRGTEAEIVAAARAAGVRAVFMTEHPTPDRRWATEGLQGMKNGVLFVPGAELSDGLLVWRGEGADWTNDMKAGEVLERLQDTEAVSFIAHPEERRGDAAWRLPRFDGMEIYNSHADAKDSGYDETLQSLRGNPLKAFTLLNTLKKYRREAFAAIFDEQAEVLQQWDRLNADYLPEGRRVVGIAANDSHQNVGVSIVGGEGNLVIRDALGKTVREISPQSLPLLLFGGLKTGSVLLAHTFDPYEVSFGYVNTHLLADEVTEGSLFQALLRGRAYVGFDWMADPSGFRYYATHGKKTVEMGGDVPARRRPRLTIRSNMPCEIRLLRNGEEVRRVEDSELTYEARAPGVYRAEAWVRIAGGARPWIYSNPIYVTGRD